MESAPRPTLRLASPTVILIVVRCVRLVRAAADVVLVVVLEGAVLRGGRRRAQRLRFLHNKPALFLPPKKWTHYCRNWLAALEAVILATCRVPCCRQRAGSRLVTAARHERARECLRLDGVQLLMSRAVMDPPEPNITSKSTERKKIIELMSWARYERERCGADRDPPVPTGAATSRPVVGAPEVHGVGAVGDAFTSAASVSAAVRPASGVPVSSTSSTSSGSGGAAIPRGQRLD